MKPKILVMFFTIALSLSLLSLSAFSADEDFLALAEDAEISSCQCTIAENIIKIGNTGSINSLYFITQEGSASDWSVIRPKSFSLEEGDTKTLMGPINIPCDAGPGEYELLTYIESGFGLKKVIKQAVIVKDSKKCAAESQIDEDSDDAGDTGAEKNDSLFIKILKLAIYIFAGLIIAVIIIIIIIYRAESAEEDRYIRESARKSSAKRKAAKSDKRKVNKTGKKSRGKK
jgi:hypothetical protein